MVLNRKLVDVEVAGVGGCEGLRAYDYDAFS